MVGVWVWNSDTESNSVGNNKSLYLLNQLDSLTSSSSSVAVFSPADSNNLLNILAHVTQFYKATAPPSINAATAIISIMSNLQNIPTADVFTQPSYTSNGFYLVFIFSAHFF